MTTEPIKLIEFFGEQKLIKNPTVIKVLSIKKKHVDQMPFTPVTRNGYGEIKIVGRTREYIVCLTTEDHLTRLSISDYRMDLHLHFRNNLGVSNTLAQDKADEIIRKIPQMFEE